jgi:hypothetical protein
MFSRLPRKYRKKYKKELGWDEEIVLFAFKVVGSATLFFVVAVGVDVYRLMH